MPRVLTVDTSDTAVPVAMPVNMTLDYWLVKT